jgi:hypothetical protein
MSLSSDLWLAVREIFGVRSTYNSLIRTVFRLVAVCSRKKLTKEGEIRGPSRDLVVDIRNWNLLSLF